MRIIFILCILSLFSSCLNKPSKQDGKVVSSTQERVPTPVQIKDPRFQAAQSFWKGFDYSNLEVFKDSIRFCNAFAAWGKLLLQLPIEDGKSLTGKLISDGNKYPQMQLKLMYIAELCFNEPNSIYRNEELYIPMLEAIIQAPGIEDLHKERFRFQYKMAMKNRSGAQASDFNYITEKGERGKLSQLKDKKNTLLYFFNPDCNDCERVKAFIAQSSIITQLQKEGRLQVLAIYPDENLEIWKRHQGKNPSVWITARYASQTDREAYYLPAIPNCYLLDKRQVVLLKDAPIEQIEAFINHFQAAF